MRVVLLGPPGAGKGTQAQFIAGKLGVPAISTGDIFRANVSGKTELGLQVKAIVDAGDYVPDSLTNELVTDRLSQADADGGFLLDGYPRTPDQVRYLEELLSSRGHQLDAVIRPLLDPGTGPEADGGIERLRAGMKEIERPDVDGSAGQID